MMTITDLADRLRRIIEAAPENRKTAMMHVAGIIFAEEIDHYGGAAIAREAGLPGWAAALTDGRNLAPCVAVDPNELKRLLKL